MKTTSLPHLCVRHLSSRLVAVLTVAALTLPVLLAAPAQPGRPQKLASPDAVPEGLSAPEWSSIRQQYEQHRHAAFPVAGGYQARNPGQQWQTRFDGRGSTTQPDGAVWQWGLELQSYGFPGHEQAVAGRPRVNTAGQRVTYDWDGTLQEWFVNDRRGLEHGFTVRERPSVGRAGAAGDYGLGRQAKRDAALAVGAGLAQGQSPLRSAGALQDAIATTDDSPLTFTLAVRGGLRPEVQADGHAVRFVDAQGAAALTYSELTVLDADGRKLPAWFEGVEENLLGSRGRESAHSPAEEDQRRLTSAATESLRLVIDERGARYPLTIDPIAQQAYVKASNTEAFDQFGTSVAVWGDTVVIGAVLESSNATGVNGNQSDNGAISAGAAYVFVRSGTNWTQQAYLKASNTEMFDQFGISVAVWGDTVVVGAVQEASNATGVNGDQSTNSAYGSGAAYVFVRNGTNWTQQAYLKASNTDAGDAFGLSVAVSGDTVAIGAEKESSDATGVNGNQSNNDKYNSGAAYVFVRSGTNWSQQAYIKASNTGRYDSFGHSVAVSGDTVVIGAVLESSNATGVNGDQGNDSAIGSGATFVFVRSGTNWSQQAYLKASNTDQSQSDHFGQSVAVSGDTVVVGADQEASNATGVNGDQSNNSALSAGAAYVFVRSGTNWFQQVYLKASNTDANDKFGFSVAVSGDTVVVGASGEGSNATGVDGDQSDNSANQSGAAYVFVRSGTDWSQQAYLKASNTDAGDQFSFSVAVSGDTVVVGAYGEASNGVDGDQSNNSAFNAGAAYLFTGLGLGTLLSNVPDGSGGFFIRFNGVPGMTYRLERAPSVAGPWDTIDTQTAPASGLIEYHETSPPPGKAFYRTAQP